jgi:hypothetical protein
MVGTGTVSPLLFIHTMHRTAQFSALVQMCLDPYSRTIVGFANLIEKEWISMGHKFNERIGHGKATDEEQVNR